MSAEEIGRRFEDWAANHNLVVLHDRTTRVCHTSNTRGECFQLVMRAPANGQVVIELFSIETMRDEELHQAWSVPVESINEALNRAWLVVEGWKRGVGRSA